MISFDSVTPAEIVEFWLGAGPEAWYKRDDAFDQKIRDRFLKVWEAARAGKLEDWPTNPRNALAMLILTDQFPRNMFRDDPRAFATDVLARKIACYAIKRNWDLRVGEPERQFFYMPLMHSERAADQDHCVRLFKERMAGGDNLLHARAHREIIRKFNRFPYRNAVLGRRSSASETAFMEDGGYGGIVRELDKQNA